MTSLAILDSAMPRSSVLLQLRYDARRVDCPDCGVDVDGLGEAGDRGQHVVHVVGEALLRCEVLRSHPELGRDPLTIQIEEAVAPDLGG